MLITPATPDDGIGCTVAEEHDDLLGILLPLKYNPPSTLLSLPLGPNPVIQRVMIPSTPLA